MPGAVAKRDRSVGIGANEEDDADEDEDEEDDEEDEDEEEPLERVKTSGLSRSRTVRVPTPRPKGALGHPDGGYIFTAGLKTKEPVSKWITAGVALGAPSNSESEVYVPSDPGDAAGSDEESSSEDAAALLRARAGSGG